MSYVTKEVLIRKCDMCIHEIEDGVDYLYVPCLHVISDSTVVSKTSIKGHDMHFCNVACLTDFLKDHL